MASPKLLLTGGIPLISAILYIAIIWYQKRSRVSQLRRLGIPIAAGWSWWTGHLLVLQRYLNRLPVDANIYMAMEELVKEHADTEIFLFDFWPAFGQVLMISGPEASMQVSNKFNLPKPASQGKLMAPVVGGPSLISMNDKDWKFWRSLLNPGFSAANMLDRVPTIVDSVAIFRDKLLSKVDTNLFSLDNLASQLTMDIITKATLDTDLDHQRSPHPLAHALDTILAWHSFWDPRILLNPLRPIVQWYYGRIMDTFVRQEIKQRFAEMKKDEMLSQSKSTKHPTSVIALALKGYISLKRQNESIDVEDVNLDEDFVKIAANQIRLFIFAGNDSTASSIVYSFHCIFKHPDVLLKLRQEHDNIFGTVKDPAIMLKEDPTLLNKCPYTLAVIKETLRLYPPSSSLRQGLENISITDIHGKEYPTQHLGATIMHGFIHTNPRLWPDPDKFLPERWLVEPGHELYPASNIGAYRPFEHGPRNCIGQTLVYNEMRIVLILTVRDFIITPAYDEWDAMQLHQESVLGTSARSLGLSREAIKTVKGERAYQTVKAGSHPADGYPCRVTLARNNDGRMP